jgi:hypothetical protein
MSTARTRFGVSILVALAMAVLLHVSPSAAARADTASAIAPDAQFDGLASIGALASLTSARTQAAVALGAGVPMLIAGVMLRRRLYADA